MFHSPDVLYTFKCPLETLQLLFGVIAACFCNVLCCLNLQRVFVMCCVAKTCVCHKYAVELRKKAKTFLYDFYM